jgi:flagellar motor switch protein FliG
MTDPDLSKLSRQQKLALFLIIIGPEAAAEVLRHFDDAEIELLCREMSQYTMISDITKNRVMEVLRPPLAGSTTLGALSKSRAATTKPAPSLAASDLRVLRSK